MTLGLRHWLFEGHHKIIASEWMTLIVDDETVKTLKHVVVYQVVFHLAKLLF